MGLTLAAVSERTTVPSLSYLGSMEAGRIHPARSKHLPSVAQALELTEKDLTRITGKPTLEGTADVREAVQLEIEQNRPTASTVQGSGDLRNAMPLTIASVIAGGWNNGAVGAYRLPADPETILVIDPQQRDLDVNRHYLVLDPMGYAIVRAVCVQDGAALKLLQNDGTIVDGAVVMGRVLFEAHPL